MGREVKRVPLEFDWPLNKIWAGYINPFCAAMDCPDCNGSGYSPEAKRLADQWYGYCERCNGGGEIWESAAAKALCESWNDIEPPEGEGWQLWETVSEGSPISPVFATQDELVSWLVTQGYSKESATAFVGVGHAPSFIMEF